MQLQPEPEPGSEPRPGRTRTVALWMRWILLGAWVVTMVFAVTTGERVGTLPALQGKLADGSVTEVAISGEGPAEGESGQATQEIHWRDGLIRRVTTVVSETAGERSNPVEKHTARIGDQDAAAYLTRSFPGLVLHQESETRSSSEVYGWTNLPAGLGGINLVVMLATLVGIVTSKDQPWRATRWAWFWLWITSIGAPLFLLLSGPFPLLPAPRPGARRLTGGWAFLIGLVIGGILTSSKAAVHLSVSL